MEDWFLKNTSLERIESFTQTYLRKQSLHQIERQRWQAERSKNCQNHGPCSVEMDLKAILKMLTYLRKQSLHQIERQRWQAERSKNCQNHGPCSVEMDLKAILKIPPTRCRFFPLITAAMAISRALSFKVSSHNKLRTLGLNKLQLEKNLTESIGNLKHLRHLDVSCSNIRKLPESISSLQNLQTLDLSCCSQLYMLPKKMKDMKSLIYLDLTGCNKLQYMPSGMGQLGCLRKLGVFIVGKEGGHHIGELQRLNHIGGELSIKDLDNVQGLADAQNANLARKTSLQSLSLSWREDNSSSFSGANSEDVLRALEPHSNMKKLEISGYRGSKFPDWMLESRLPNLVEISLQSCMNCEHLPPFGKLRMHTVKCIGSEMYGDGENPFPSLERLTLGEMMNLEDWETNSMGGREIFTCLHELQIEKCPKLVELPIIPSVKYLTIGDSTVTLLSLVATFTSITSLQIEGFDELVVLPDGLLQNHTCLQKLSIEWMRSLRSLSNQLNNLSSLNLPDGVQNLNSLGMLSICGIPKITALSVLPSSLATLRIVYCKELTSLSEGLQYLTALKDLKLIACVKLNSLPGSIRHLNSLRCSNLMSLPEGIRNLKMLRELEIKWCPNLERRCKKEKGEDWPNIAHILTSALGSILLGNLNTLVLEELGLVFDLQTEFEKLKRTFMTVQAVLKDAEEKQKVMAEAVTSALGSILLGNLNTRVLEELGLVFGLQIEFEKLNRTFMTVQAVLKDAEEKQQRRGLKDRLRSFFSLHQNSLFFRFKMPHKLKNVRKKFDAIAMEKNKFKLTEGVGENEADKFDWRITSSYVNTTEIYGRDKEKEELISMLLANSDDLSVYAIHGMGGLGKTTLAQLVYSDASVEGRFDLRIWVCVSDDFDIRRLSRAIIESIEDKPCTLQELDTLQRHLQEKLIGRRFLLVLDDVWDHYHEKWNALKDALRVGAGGCAIIITTRLKQVADRMATIPVHQMGRLSEDDSWLLFERHAFGARRREEYVHLESIGKAIVNKCDGVPLALKALGSSLRGKRTELEWLYVKESVIWDLPEDECGRILPALKLSYNNLPPHLKQCFGFCCMFPKDYVMKKDQLVRLWLANGFIDPEGQMDFHETGYEIFDDLVGRSIFQEVKEDDFGNITCKMHDLMHDLATSVMIEECCLIERNRRPRIPKTVRHISFDGPSRHYYEVRSLRSLRSLIFSMALSFKVSSHNKLRTLGLNKMQLEKNLTESIGNLKHLRYLDVSCSFILELPESISSLQNLQTLDLSCCPFLYMLPKKMKDMKSLIYLDLTGCDALQCMPSGMGQLGCLRKLGMFIVGKEVGHRIGELQRLNYIGGELSIKDLDNVQGFADAQNANLARKTNLQSLSLSWREDENSKFSEANSEDVLRALEPHSNMKKLEISGYRGSKFADWMLESRLPNLVEIVLQSCMNCEHLPPFGKLRFLKHLQLKRTDNVKCIGSEMYGDGENPFPSLERLTLGEMINLEDWETNSMGGREIFTCLHELQIEKCPKLVELPIIPSVKYLTIKDCTVTLLSSVVNFTSITSLRIKGFDELAVLPDGLLQNHTRLQKLSIKRMRSLRSLSNQLNNLSSLKYLNIKYCDELESLPEGVQNLNSLEILIIVGLPKITALSVLPSSLATLQIGDCKELASLSEGLQYLTALKYLILYGCVRLNSLPESIRHLSSLGSLAIFDCLGISCVPNQIRHLTSLSRMYIDGCSKLKSLPEGIRNLEMLRELIITDCPNLERGCKKEKGRDWPNIAHIRTIIINDQVIQSS
ncbi:hypothetical protein SADUNF_Sadunf17G0112600 [Salix dunnii]|uniref:Uncharacterized protein n=1 Tax=Salix dunnii TaxID=1413687 RepID=A0A835J947_9ROSI|nr:hypothetical protein SADUNF_Sadunf17G0112600 [Salix dunnii]